MVELSLTVRTVSPLSLRANRAQTQFAASLDYIPGSALRGALAGRYLAGDAGRARDAVFRQLFLEDRVQFPDLLPADNPGTPWTLLPATAYGCKRFPEKHGRALADFLLRLELADNLMAQGRADWRIPLTDVEACPECRAKFAGAAAVYPRDRLGLGYAKSWSDFFEPGSVAKRMLTGTAIDRTTSTAAPAMLFSQEVIERDRLFTGRVRLAGDTADTMIETLRQTLAPVGESLHLGRGRTRGLGHVEVTDWNAVTALSRKALEQQMGALNQTAARLWAHYNAGAPEGQFFTLTLESHLALQTALGVPLLGSIEPADLGLPGAAWGRRALTPVAVPGWNAAWGMPKHETWAIGRGSVLLGRIAEADRDTTLAALLLLATEGAGERRTEGFGRIQVCAPFHYRLTQLGLG